MSATKRAAQHEPVFITDRGTPCLVLLTIDDDDQTQTVRVSVADALALPASLADAVDDDFTPPTLEIGLKVPQ